MSNDKPSTHEPPHTPMVGCSPMFRISGRKNHTKMENEAIDNRRYPKQELPRLMVPNTGGEIGFVKHNETIKPEPPCGGPSKVRTAEPWTPEELKAGQRTTERKASIDEVLDALADASEKIDRYEQTLAFILIAIETVEDRIVLAEIVTALRARMA